MHGLNGLPSEWKPYTHPDGKPYFQHLTWRVVTEAYIWNPDVRRDIEQWYHRVEAARTTKPSQVQMSDRRELYLTLYPKQGYYYVDHDTQSVFWLEEVPLDRLGLSKGGPARSFGKRVILY
jgi:hypothetical protein